MKVTQEDWKKRLEEVLIASQDCKSVIEIAEITDYSRSLINNLLKKFPKEAELIRQNLQKNATKTKTKKKKRKGKTNYKRRLNKLLEASQTCKSLAELSRMTGFSNFIIKSTLSKFPEEEEKVKQTLLGNKTTKEPKEEKTITSKKSSNSDNLTVIIDTSIVGVPEYFSILKQYVEEGKILGITDVVLEEILKLRSNGSSTIKASANNMLHIIMDNLSCFRLYEIKHDMEEKQTNDEAIIKCSLNEKNSLLLTSDKEMYIKCRLKGGKARYLEHEDQELRPKIKFLENSKNKKDPDKKFVDFFEVSILYGRLIYNLEKRENQFKKIFSKEGIEKKDKQILVDIGDHVYIYTQKQEYATFADYELCDSQSNKWMLCFSYKIYEEDSFEERIKNQRYIDFIKRARQSISNRQNQE